MIPFLSRGHVLSVGELPKTLKYPVFTKAATSTIKGGWKNQAHICNNEEDLLAVYKTINTDKILVQEYVQKKNELCINGMSISGGGKKCYSVCV